MFQHALAMKARSKGDKKEHWLDYASNKYDQVLIADTKSVLQILLLFIPLPVFWALYDQQVGTDSIMNLFRYR